MPVIGAIKATVEKAMLYVEETEQHYNDSKTFERIPRYRTSVNELADAIAAMVPNLTFCASWHSDVYEDVFDALRERHPNFDRELRGRSSRSRCTRRKTSFERSRDAEDFRCWRRDWKPQSRSRGARRWRNPCC
jgi:hypothetical protein